MIASVPEEKATRGASRYDAIIATLVGFLALVVSGYTAYMQRQQVRGAVWPILEFNTSNHPNIHLTLANKGVGPAIVGHVTVRVSGQPVRNWSEALDKMVGPGKHWYSESDMSGHVFAAGESMTILTPNDDNGNPLTFDEANPLWTKMNKARQDVEVEICYCSTLGDCWTLRSGDSKRGTTTESRGCPSQSSASFQQ